MKRDEVRYTTASGTVTVVVGAGVESVSSFFPLEKTVFIIDDNVYALHKEKFPDVPRIIIHAKEEDKNLKTVESIYAQLQDLEVDRFSNVVVVGGGIATDTGGYAASTYLRGLKFGFVSTTLLAQVDASVGGKNGVNYRGYKNLIGTITQPEFVFCDTSMLSTLGNSEFVTGAAEIIKHAYIADAEMIDYLQDNTQRFLSRDAEVIHHLVLRSVQIKANVVERDSHENSVRRTLNFGHTMAHALEKCNRTSHGAAVAAGMVFAARISRERGLIDQSIVDSLENTVKAIGLPHAVSSFNVKAEELKEAILHDKKRQSDNIHFALLDGRGKCRIEMIPVREVEAYIDAMCLYR